MCTRGSRGRGPGKLWPARHGRACEVRAVGAGLKLVYKETTLSSIYVIDHVSNHPLFILSRGSSVCWKLTSTSWTNKEFLSQPPSSTTSASSPPPPITTSHNHSTTPTMTTMWQHHITSQMNGTQGQMDSDNNVNTHRFDGMKMFWHVNRHATSSRQWWHKSLSLSTWI